MWSYAVINKNNIAQACIYKQNYKKEVVKCRGSPYEQYTPRRDPPRNVHWHDPPGWDPLLICKKY